MNKFLPVPGCTYQLVDGSVVILDRFPGLKWVVHYGWYSYNGAQYQGWYFSSIPSQTVIPVTPEDLRMLQVIQYTGSDTDPGCPVPTYPYPICPPPSPEQVPLSEKQKEEILEMLKNYYTKEEVDQLLDGKQDKVSDNG